MTTNQAHATEPIPQQTAAEAVADDRCLNQHGHFACTRPVGHPDDHEALGLREVWPATIHNTAQRAHRSRTTTPVCPPWCAGHNDIYQPWERHVDGRLERGHDEEEGAVFGALSVVLSQTEDDTTGLQPPTVTVYANEVAATDSHTLTPAEARELGTALLRAADVLSQFEVRA